MSDDQTKFDELDDGDQVLEGVRRMQKFGSPYEGSEIERVLEWAKSPKGPAPGTDDDEEAA